MVNIWNQYQCMVTFNMSRSASYFESGTGRGMGFRDSCQDLLGFVHLIPERARTRILDIAATQMEDGSAYHQYQPLTKRGNLDIGSGFNDDPLWLIAAVAAYLKETGEPFQTTGPSEGPVAESIFIAGMFVKYGREYAKILELLGKDEKAKKLSLQLTKYMMQSLRMDGMENGSSVLTMLSATKWDQMKMKKVRSLSSLRDSAFWPV